MEVPGLIAWGSIIQRSTQSGFKRSLATRKLGAVAMRSWAGSPVAWHLRQGAAGLLNRLLAISVSFADSTAGGCGTYGRGCLESASKKRTSLPNSFSEKEKVGMRTCR